MANFEETHVNCDFCGKWYNPEWQPIYNISDDKEKLGLTNNDKRENCCEKCYQKMLKNPNKDGGD